MPIFLLGALLATFLLSRLALWSMRKWDGGMMRLLAAHAISFAICWAVFAFGSSDGKVYAGAGLIYLLPQGIWFLVDHFRGKGAKEA